MAASPRGLTGTRASRPGALTLGDPLVWRDHTGEQRIAAAEIASISASYVGHLQTFWIGGLLLAILARAQGLEVIWGIGALWGAALGRFVLDRLRPRIDVLVDARGERFTVRLEGWEGFDEVQRMRRQLGRGTSSPDELLAESRRQLRSQVREERILGRWNAFWVAVAPVAFWVLMWLIAVGLALRDGKPLAETLVIPGMGLPIAYGLWPLSGWFGLIAQIPFTPVLRWSLGSR